jgi:guanine nucleotide-binding protein G(s) subunit alpha
MRILHINGFSDAEKREKVQEIRRNVRDSIMVSFQVKFIQSLLFQVILKSMDEIDPPVKLDNPANEASKAYILEVASKPDFDYPQASIKQTFYYAGFRYFTITLQNVGPIKEYKYALSGATNIN